MRFSPPLDDDNAEPAGVLDEYCVSLGWWTYAQVNLPA
jgi:hypothetical protein